MSGYLDPLSSNLIPNSRGFKMAFLNIASIPKYIDLIRISDFFRSFDLLAFNETRLHPSISDKEVNLFGYDIIRKDRCRKGGGVCIFLRNSVNYRKRNELIPDDLEGVCLEIINPYSKPFIVATVYRPPDCTSEFFHSFDDMIKAIDNENHEMHILSDMNCDLLKTIPDNPTKKYNSILEMYQLSQTIDKPTRITKTSKSLIDHHVTNSLDKLVFSGVIHASPSDHSLIYAIRKTNSVNKAAPNVPFIEFRNMKRFNVEQFVHDLHCQPWELITYESEINSMWALWKKLFLEILDRHAPIQKKRKRPFNDVPWLTRELKELIHKRDNFKRKAIMTNRNLFWDEYKSLRNMVNIALRQAKAKYYHNKMALLNDNPKEAWRSINNLLGKTPLQPVVKELKINDVTYNSPEKISEAFNEYFSAIGTSLSQSLTSSKVSFESFVKPLHANADPFRFECVTITQVLQMLNGLSKSKGTGIDNISGKILKVAASAISPSLTYLFNWAISSCCFPDDWKVAKVMPLFKKGDRNLPDNYRPISILPSISKLIERILYDQLFNHLTACDVLHERQFGFRKFHSTTSALLDSTNSWYTNMDRGYYNLVVFLDLKKAFDTVNHELLLRKFELYGITCNALELLKSYLTDRKQMCQINGIMSPVNSINCGIPQGSILGPLFFLLYINDLPNCLRLTTARLFADDTNLTASGSSIIDIERAMNEDLSRIKEWLLANKLSLNVAKTEFMLIGSHSKLGSLSTSPSLMIDQTPLKQVFHSKMLGVEVDQYLSWDMHIDNIAKSITSGIGVLRRVRDFVDRKTLILIYNAIVQPYFIYCSEVWDTMGEGLSNRLQKLQNRSARVIARMSNDTPHEEALKELGWETLDVQRHRTKAKQMFKVLHQNAPACLSDLFTFKRDVTCHNLRGSSTSLQLPLPKRDFKKKSFSYHGAKLWNSLPEPIRSCESYSLFKSKIATHILSLK